MTLPDERYRALEQLPGVLLRRLDRPGAVSKSELRRLVSMLLRHYPTSYELQELARRAPKLLKR